MHFAVIDTELKPLCTRHLQPMNRVDIYWKPEGAENLSCMTGYRCVIIAAITSGLMAW
jgi:hypothetical protein